MIEQQGLPTRFMWCVHARADPGHASAALFTLLLHLSFYIGTSAFFEWAGWVTCCSSVAQHAVRQVVVTCSGLPAWPAGLIQPAPSSFCEGPS
jgi:hypothetical protein